MNHITREDVRAIQAQINALTGALSQGESDSARAAQMEARVLLWANRQRDFMANTLADIAAFAATAKTPGEIHDVVAEMADDIAALSWQASLRDAMSRPV